MKVVFDRPRGTVVNDKVKILEVHPHTKRHCCEHDSNNTVRLPKTPHDHCFVVFVRTGVEHPKHSIVTDSFSSWGEVSSIFESVLEVLVQTRTHVQRLAVYNDASGLDVILQQVGDHKREVFFNGSLANHLVANVRLVGRLGDITAASHAELLDYIVSHSAGNSRSCSQKWSVRRNKRSQITNAIEGRSKVLTPIET